jgi:hypothetical protein
MEDYWSTSNDGSICAPEYGINEDQWDGYPAEENGFYKRYE